MTGLLAVFTDVLLELYDQQRQINSGKAEDTKHGEDGAQRSRAVRTPDEDCEEMQSLYPELNLYIFTRNGLDSEMMDFARDYLDYGDQIVFVMNSLLGSGIVWLLPPKEEVVIDISNVPLGTMPVIDGRELESEEFGVYRIVKGERSKKLAAEHVSNWTDDMMARFTAVFTDLPLEPLGLKWTDPEVLNFSPQALGVPLTNYFFEHKAVFDLYPDMHPYFSHHVLNSDLMDLAREYLVCGDRMIFVNLQFQRGCNWTLPPMEETVIDISDVPPGTMPVIGGKEFVPKLFSICKVVREEKDDRLTRFTAVFTDLPLEPLGLPSVEECSWIILSGYRTILSNYFSEHGWDADPYPDMNMYYSPLFLDRGIMDLAREYLEHGELIIFVSLRYKRGVRWTFPPMEETVIDISDVPPWTMPVIDGKEFFPKVFSICRVVKGKK